MLQFGNCHLERQHCSDSWGEGAGLHHNLHGTISQFLRSQKFGEETKSSRSYCSERDSREVVERRDELQKSLSPPFPTGVGSEKLQLDQVHQSPHPNSPRTDTSFPIRAARKNHVSLCRAIQESSEKRPVALVHPILYLSTSGLPATYVCHLEKLLTGC